MIVNTSMVKFEPHVDEYGSLVAVEGKGDAPFSIKRIYYIYGVDQNQRRGFHSHNDLEQVLVCVHGKVKILVKTPFEEEVVELDDPSKGLYIGPMVWREMFDWQDDAVLLVLASKHYDVEDYIRDYAKYETLAKEYFEGEKK